VRRKLNPPYPLPFYPCRYALDDTLVVSYLDGLVEITAKRVLAAPSRTRIAL
jgi:hypothetical protein